VLRAQQLSERVGVGERTRFICAQLEQLETSDVGGHDLALCLEVIEHVANPSLILGTGFDLAEAIIFSTPHMQVGNENRKSDGVHLSHVREFHFVDLLRLSVTCGGRMETLTTAYWEYTPEGGPLLPGFGNWVGEIVRGGKEKASIVFYVGGAMEKWTPDSIGKGGIGGSETAVAQMARLFSEAGHQVFVYGPVDGVWNGVVYRNYKRFVPHSPAMGNPCLLFVSSRVPEIFDKRVNAVMTGLWFHDWDYGYDMPTGRLERLTKERAEQIDFLFVLSDAQKHHFEKTYPFLKGRLTVTANGIDPGRFTGLKEERLKHRFIWSSSPDRGLARVLRMWPSIRRMWEDAELHVFYGFQYVDLMYPRQHPKRKEMVDDLFALMEQEGVTHHGRVNQDELAREFAKSQFWFYPTSFTETYCITAIEAQAVGCTPVTSSTAALADKVPARFRLKDTASDDKFLNLLRHVDEGKVDPLTDEEMAKALATTWQSVFEQWEKALDTRFEERKKVRMELEKTAAKEAFAARKKKDGRK
jgi:glycosyltransferase involved in cell wall biosynthesis